MNSVQNDGGWQRAERLRYPASRTVDVTETLAGVTFPDPYRWLEADDAEVRDWQRAQAELAAGYVREWPHFDLLRSAVARMTVARFESVPRWSAGRWFRAQVPDGASQAQVIVSDTPYGEGQVAFDPADEDATAPPFLSWLSPSPDGQVLAVGVCTDGSEHNTIRLIDTATGALLFDPPAQVLMDNWTGGAQWLPDSSGFFFSAFEGDPSDYVGQVFLHRRRPLPSTEVVPAPWGPELNYRAVFVAGDGRWAVAVDRLMDPVPVALAALDGPELEWRPFVTTVTGTVAGHVVGDRYIAITDVDAPRGRLVAIDLDSPNPNDPRTWHDLIPSSDAVLRTVTPVGDNLYISEFVDTYARVRIVDHDGTVQGELPLPGNGALADLPFPMMTMAPKGHPGEYLFAFSSLVESWGVYRHTPGTASLEVLAEPKVRIEGAVVEDRWATSLDGTQIPYHVVSLAGTRPDTPRAALIYGYGGFNAPWVPQYPGPMATFITAGGVFVHTHIRGGAEFGLPWWEGGRMANKQNGYDDLYAIAEQLIADRVTSSELLGVTGASNGGLMAAVAVTQRPELWALAVPRVPDLDMIGACRDTYGRMNMALELGDPDDPDDVRRVGAYSPYQQIVDGTVYPAMFIDAGDTDYRCPPWHARKFGARMQAAQAGDAPVLIRIWENVGHGWATDKDTAITQQTEWLAFTMHRLRLVPEAGRRPPR